MRDHGPEGGCGEATHDAAKLHVAKENMAPSDPVAAGPYLEELPYGLRVASRHDPGECAPQCQDCRQKLGDGKHGHQVISPRVEDLARENSFHHLGDDPERQIVERPRQRRMVRRRGRRRGLHVAHDSFVPGKAFFHLGPDIGVPETAIRGSAGSRLGTPVSKREETHAPIRSPSISRNA